MVLLQFIPFDVVEETFVGANFLGLDWFEQVPAVVCEGTHQVVLLIAAREKTNLFTMEPTKLNSKAGYVQMQYERKDVEMMTMLLENISQ